MRNAIIRHIQRDGRFTVVGTAVNGREAVARAAELKPDVITMDVEMPEMDGIAALRQIHAKAQIPIIMVSSQTEAGAKTTMQALNAGAMDFIPKAGGFEQLHEKLHAVVGAMRARTAPTDPAPPPFRAARVRQRRFWDRSSPKLSSSAAARAVPAPCIRCWSACPPAFPRPSSSPSTCRRTSPPPWPNGCQTSALSKSSRRRKTCCSPPASPMSGRAACNSASSTDARK